jgi:hypothetical protein
VQKVNFIYARINQHSWDMCENGCLCILPLPHLSSPFLTPGTTVHLCSGRGNLLYVCTDRTSSGCNLCPLSILTRNLTSLKSGQHSNSHMLLNALSCHYWIGILFTQSSTASRVGKRGHKMSVHERRRLLKSLEVYRGHALRGKFALRIFNLPITL